jgi:hypothetical protein
VIRSKPILPILIATIILSATLIIGGCTKCYRCYSWEGYISATNGTNAFYFYDTKAGFSRTVDSLKALGYSVDTFPWMQDGEAYKVCTNKGIHFFESVGDSCAER